MTRVVRVAALALALAACGTARARADVTLPDSTAVVYVAGGSIYVNAGRAHGLAEGDTLAALRDGGTIAWLRVNVLSTQRAACDTLRARDLPRIGDRVRWLSGPPRPAPAATDVRAPAAADTAAARGGGAPAVAAPPALRPRPWLRGWASGQWSSVRTSYAARLDEPSFALRLAAGRPGEPVQLGLDVRGRRTTRSTADGYDVTDALSRVYRADALLRDAADRWRLALGRQSEPALAPVSLFDGARLERAGRAWRAGAFAGSQPEPLRMAVSSRIVEGGLYAERTQAPGAPRVWSAGAGAIVSYDHGAPDRQFAFAQAFWRGRRLTATLLQEADAYRAWQRALGERAVSLTSTFATANLQASSWLALQAGYDNRRSVRLWRDRETPETAFDDAYRQGAWSGLSLSAGRWRLSGEGRQVTSAGERDGGWSAVAEVSGITRWRASARARAAGYRGTAATQGLWAASAGVEPWPGWRLDGEGGRRTTRTEFQGLVSTDWLEASAQAAITRGWFAMLTATGERGDGARTTFVLGSLGFRF